MKKLLLNGLGDYLTMESRLRIVIVNGMPGCGKTTFENYCKEELGVKCEIVSTIDIIKKMAKIGGWNGEKDPKSRKLLSDLKDLWTAYNDLSFNTIKNFITSWEEELKDYHVIGRPHVLFVDCREPKEIQHFKTALGATTLLIRRPDIEDKEQSNHADKEVLNYEYDWIIHNTGDKEHLKKLASGFLDLLFCEN